MSNAELFVAVERWALANYGLRAEGVAIRIRGLAEPVSLPIFTTAPPAAPNAEDEKDHRGLSPVLLDVLAVLREATRPLSRTLILEELAKRGKLWNERTVAGYLAQLVQDGTLENIQEGKQRGYRLPAEEER